MDVFPARIATPAGVVFEGPVWQIRACNTCGSFAVRAHHAPFLTEMSAGTIEVAAAPDSRKRFAVSAGLLEFYRNTCRIVCEQAAVVRAG